MTLDEIYRDICFHVSKDPDANVNGHCPSHDDSTGSLSVTLIPGEKILLKCFAGCSYKSLCADLGYKESDLFQPKPGRSSSSIPAGGSKETSRPATAKKTTPKKSKPKKEHIPGTMTLERLAEKKALPEQWLRDQYGLRNGSNAKYGKYISIPYWAADKKPLNLGRLRPHEKASTGMIWKYGAKPTLYGLWFLPRIKELGWTVLVEGESDCWTLWHHKLPCLGIPGADMIGKIEPAHVAGLRRVFVFLEPDRGGVTFKEKIPARLKEIEYTGEICFLSLADYEDPSDLHVKGGPEEFDRVFKAALKDAEAKPYRPEEQPPTKPEDKPDALTDLGNAERIRRKFGAYSRWCEEWKEWFIWDGKRWGADKENKIMRLAARTVRNIYNELSALSDNRDKRDALFAHAKKSEGKQRIMSMIELTKALEGTNILSSQLDSHSELLTVNNGVVDLPTGKLLPARQDYYLTRLAPVDYDSSATCPTWLKFLDQIMEGDQEMVKFLQRAVGYSLTGLCNERCFFILHGEGKNGKSTFLETIQAMLADYALRTPTATLMAQRNAPGGAQASPDLARLKGPRFVTASESEAGQMLSEALVKDLTGQDTITARRLYGDLFDFKPEFKIWLCTNNKPIIRGTDPAIWDRIKLIPFTYRVPPQEQDGNLGKKLTAELPGILQWAIKGCLEWYSDGLSFPSKIIEAVEEYKSEMDILADWLEDCCYTDVNDYDCTCSNTELYKCYRNYGSERSTKLMAQRTFTGKLKGKGFVPYKSGSIRKWRGIRPLSEEELNTDFNEWDTRDTRDTKSSKSTETPYACEKVTNTSVPSVPSVPLEAPTMELDQFRGGKNL
jgi:putative DNA primase/helicase